MHQIVSLLIEAPKKGAKNGQPESPRINIHGNKGCGKTRLAVEVVEHLRYRYFYEAGIFHIDLSQVSDFEQVHDILNLGTVFSLGKEEGTAKAKQAEARSSGS